MNPKDHTVKKNVRIRRVAAIAVAATVVLGSQAFADTSTVPVTVGVVNGTRSLQVTGVDGTGAAPGAGPVALAFNRNTTSAPFGVVVTDAAYTRTGYDVEASLSDLYRIDGSTDATPGFDCTDGATNKIESSAFTLGYDGSPVDLSGFAAVIEAPLQFAGDVSAIAGLSGTLNAALSAVPRSVPVDPATLGLMSVTDGANGAFGSAAAHGVCGNADASPTTRILQSGAPNDSLDLTALAADLWTAALAEDPVAAGGDGDGSLSPDEAIAAGLLEPGADSVGGRLFLEVENVLQATYPLLTITDALVLQVIATLEMGTAPVLDAATDLIGQTGVYGNVPTLTYSPSTSASTGLYQGTMTVTLTDR